jgi:8-oxo-dGTP pyrophosphatase MutT (NUDIX family)
VLVTQITLSQIRNCLEARKPRRIDDPKAWEAAIAIILVEASAGSPELLLIRRAEKEGDPWSGQMGLPGGRREGADEGLLDTVTREVFEETRVALGAASLLGQLDDFQPQNPLLPRVIVRPFVFGLPARPEVLPNQEVALHMWASIDALLASSARTQVEVQGTKRYVDAYLLGPASEPHVVWGMTYRILTPFFELITT